MLESEYPRLLRAVNELRSRIAALSPSAGYVGENIHG
jgi:hypothetical protein